MMQTRLDNRGAYVGKGPHPMRHHTKPQMAAYITKADDAGIQFKTFEKTHSGESEAVSGFISFDDVRTPSRRRNLVRAMTRGCQSIYIVGLENAAALAATMAAAKSEIGLKSQKVIII